MHFWISWFQPTEDYRPVSDPPNKRIFGWWCTGQRCSDGAATLVAHVQSESEEKAKEAVCKDWPEAEDWRFCNETDAELPGDRFPLHHYWMKKRFKATA